jgi:predicted GH43/DUF377 family glycosyl hydrolase
MKGAPACDVTLGIMESFEKCVDEVAAKVPDGEEPDIVVGIPFYNEKDTIGPVIEAAVQGLRQLFPDRTPFVICAGSPVGTEALRRIEEIASEKEGEARILSFLMDDLCINGKGWSIRAIMRIAAKLHSHLVILSADLLPRTSENEYGGLGPEWIGKFAEPIVQHDMDFVIPRFVTHHFDDVIESHIAYPLITSVFGTRIRQPITGKYAMSYRLVRTCLGNSTHWTRDTGQYGIDPWLTINAIASEAKVCEVSMGLKRHIPNPGKMEVLFRQIVGSLFEQIAARDDWWQQRGNLVGGVTSMGAGVDMVPEEVRLISRELVGQFRQRFNQIQDTLLKRILSEETYVHLEAQADAPKQLSVSSDDWARIVNEFLLAYAFIEEFDKNDILNALHPIFLARLATYVKEIETLRKSFSRSRNEQAELLIHREAERLVEVQAEEFIREKPAFVGKWKTREAEVEPYLPKLGSWEFVPKVGVMVPQEIEKPTGGSVLARDVYRELIDRYREEFATFVHDRLDVPKDASSEQIADGIRNFILSVEKDMDSLLFPGDLHTIGGAEQVAKAIFDLFPHKSSFSVGRDKAYKLIRRYPPRDFITILPCRDLAGLLELYEPCDALALASWSEPIEYRERIRQALRKECTPDDFQYSELKPLVVDHRLFPALAITTEITAVSRLTGRIVVGTLPKGKGGDFPKLRYFLSMAKNTVEAEFFGEIWAQFAREEVDFAERLVASIEGHWGRRVLSAHNFFENKQHRIIVSRVRQMAERLRERAREEHRPPLEGVAGKLDVMVDSYHLSLTMSDAKFIPCSAWTWASYSSKGGQGHPTPLSVLVERDWATRDFIVSYLEKAESGTEKMLDQKIIELIGEGNESEDLGEILLGTTKEAEKMVLRQLPGLGQTPARKMRRPVDHPILEPIKDHPWESKYVLNCAAVRLDGVIDILYRAFGDDEISRIGLAWTRDGCSIEGRLEEPIFGPEQDCERLGCEDPRVTVIGDELYMLYTAFDGEIPQIAMASITKQAFIDRDWKAWKRLGLGFPGLANKDAVLYPEKFDGRYAIYHRIDPNMWVSYLDTLACPFPREGHRIVIGPRPGMMWDSIKIGAGAQPIKTEFGWLNIYHGVDYLRYYRLGVVLVDLKDPAEVLYQSPNPVLEPEADYELGEEGGAYWVPRVVFTCGAVPAKDKDVLGEEDEIFVYYGAADTFIGVATAKISELIPADVRKRIKAR